MPILECPFCKGTIKVAETTIIKDGLKIGCPCGTILTIEIDVATITEEEEDDYDG